MAGAFASQVEMQIKDSQSKTNSINDLTPTIGGKQLLAIKQIPTA